MTLRRRRKPAWTEMREDHEKAEVVPMHSCFHKFFWKVISYVNEKELVRGDSRSNLTQPPKYHCCMQGMVLPPARTLKLES